MSLDTQTPAGALLDEMVDLLLALPESERPARLATFTPAQLKLLDLALRRIRLLPHQRPPEGDWDTWLMLTGRGVGKTVAGSHWLDTHMQGPPCDDGIPGGHRAAIVAPTHNDAYEAITGPRCLTTQNPAVVIRQVEGATYVHWPNQAVARIFGVNTPRDIDRLRAGGNRCAVWCEELAAWPKLAEAWSHIDFGLRIGPHPKRVCTTTPRPKPLIRQLRADTTGKVAITLAATKDNPHLDPETRKRLYDSYAGTRLGRQELEGEILDDNPGALWTYDGIDQDRYRGEIEDGLPTAVVLTRIVVGVDPGGAVTEDASHTGIVVAARGRDGHGYVLADYTTKASPAAWSALVSEAFHTFNADRVVAERNFGGDMVEYTLRSLQPDLPIKMVRASRGKAIRAEPVAGLYEQHKVHHVGNLPFLEDQMTTWDPEDADAPSPDRMDALVWALTDLLVTGPKFDPVSVSPGGVTGPSYWRTS